MIEYIETKKYPLRKKMDKKHLTIRQLGELSGVHYTYISRLLTGKARASKEVINRLDACL